MAPRYRGRNLIRPVISPGMLDGMLDFLRSCLWCIRKACRRGHCHAWVPKLLAQVLVNRQWLEVAFILEQHEYMAAIIGASDADLGAHVLGAVICESH